MASPVHLFIERLRKLGRGSGGVMI